MAKTKDLLPCPFCGSTNLRIGKAVISDDSGEHDCVECMKCEATNRIDHWNVRGGLQLMRVKDE